MARIFYAILCVLTMPLSAGPVIRILETDSSHFPDIEILAEVGRPYVPAMAKDEPRFSIEESTTTSTKEVSDFKVITSNDQADRLILSIVFDATGSIPMPDFKKSQHAAGTLLTSLATQDRIAIYEIKGGPALVNGFSGDRAALKSKIEQIKRIGRTTRVFDALHSGIFTAREGILRNKSADVNSTQIARAAVVLFTDGRDEGSFLSDEDCMQLAELGNRLRVGVYTVLYGRAKNQNIFQRLSLRTGGDVITSLEDSSMQKLAKDLHSLTDRTFKIKYRSSMPANGEERNIKLSFKSGETADEDVTRVRITSSVPVAEKWYDRFLSLTWTGIALLLAGLLLFVVSIVAAWIYWKKTAPQKPVPVVTQPADTAVIATEATQLTTVSAIDTTDPDHDMFIKADDESQKQAPASAHVIISKTDGQIHLPEGEVAASDLAPATAEHPLHPAQVYLRENAYRILQEAIRGAPTYGAASVVRNREGAEREYDLFLDSTVLGSGRWASIRVQDSIAGKSHAKITRVDGHYVLYDLMSGSGVYLNGQKLLRPRALHDGDEIKIGRSEFHFRGKKSSIETVANSSTP